MPASSSNNFIFNASKLITATTFAQILGILVTPLLTRLYAPEVFGLLQIYLAIVALISPLCTCNYEIAILMPDDDEDARSILWVAIFLTTMVSILCLMGLYLPVDPILKALKAQHLGLYIYFIPLSIFCAGAFNSLSYWLTRKENFGLIAIGRSTQAFVNQGIKIVLGFFSAGSFISFLSGNILSDIVQVLIFLIKCSGDFLDIKGKFSWKRIKDNMVRYYRFPLFSLPAKFVYQGAAELPAFMLAYFFSPTILGFYALGHKLLWMPMNIVSQAVSRVLLQQMASKQNDEAALKKLVTRVLESLAIVSILPMAVIGLTAPDIFDFIFGEQWYQAGIFTSLLCFWGICGFIFPPFFELTSIFHKQHVYLFYNIFSFSVRLAALFIGGGLLKNSLMAIGLLSLSMGVLVSSLGFLVLRYVNVRYTTILEILGRHGFSAAVSLLPIILTKCLGMPRVWLLLTVPSSFLIYIFFLRYRENELFNEVLRFLRKRYFAHRKMI